MYGHIARITSKPGQREALLGILLGNIGAMPGCLSYVIAMDDADADAIWVTELWKNQAAHTASLALPEVKATITKAMPLIAGVDPRIETTPVGGIGLPGASGFRQHGEKPQG
jgi:quinol monooxygenase YgiN